jgi:peptide/nickel transport system substrate-binding protein
MRCIAMTLMAGLALASTALNPARAEDGKTLRIGTGGAFTSLDPHYHALTPNNVIADYLFATLVQQDPQYKIQPSLAVSWTLISDTVWEFKLRPGVKFHDGSDFTAEDVKFSFARIPTILNSPSSFNANVKPITQLEVVDPLTIRVHTASPWPLAPFYLAQPRIVNHVAAAGATQADFNSGKAAIGTGPYRFVSSTLGDNVVFKRFDGWWGGKLPWENVIYRVIANDASRTAAVQAGDVDIIDAVPTRDVPALKNDPKLVVYSAPGPRLIYIGLDSGRDHPPGVLGPNGETMDKNPLKDPKVRQALSLAINREGIKTQIMDGQALPTGQLVAPGMSGYDATLKPDAYNPTEARKLLAEAGFPNGFSVVLAGPNDRYVNDHQIEEAIAQMWTRIGVKTTVNSAPSSVFFSSYARDELGTWLVGWSSDTGEASSPLVTMIGSSIPEKGWGGGATFRASHFSDKAIDAIIDKALTTTDTAAREQLYYQATRDAMSLHALLPLHNQVNIWAARKGIKIDAGMLEGTRAVYITPDAS